MEKNKVRKADVLLAAVVVGGIFIATITTGTGTSVVLVPSAYADANCDKAAVTGNNQMVANAKQCQFSDPDTEGEQPRACDSPNWGKDNDGDNYFFCVRRGN
jgi:hypothetical protein